MKKRIIKKKKTTSVKCTFTSVWDSGLVIRSMSNVTTPCVYNPKTGEVTPEVYKGEVSGTLERQFITLPDGEDIEVCSECQEYVIRPVMNPGQAKHDLIEEGACSNPDCPSHDEG